MTLNSSQSNTDSDVDSIATDEEENLVVDENTKQNQSDAIAAVGGRTKESSQVMDSVAEGYDRDANAIKSEFDQGHLKVLTPEGKTQVIEYFSIS